MTEPKTYEETIEEKLQNLSPQSLASGEAQLKKVRSWQSRGAKLIVGAYVLLALYIAIESNFRIGLGVNLTERSTGIVGTILFSIMLIVVPTLLYYSVKRTRKDLDSYIQKGLIGYGDPVHVVKPGLRGKGYIVVLKDRFLYFDHAGSAAHQEIMYDDIQLITYDYINKPTVNLQVFECLTCIYTNKDAYVFSALGRSKFQSSNIIYATNPNPGEIGNEQPYRKGDAFIRDADSVGIKTYYHKISLPFWRSTTFALWAGLLLFFAFSFILSLGLSFLLFIFDI